MNGSLNGSAHRLLESLEIIRLVKNDGDEIDELRFCKSCGKYEQVEEGYCESCLQELDEGREQIYEERRHPDER